MRSWAGLSGRMKLKEGPTLRFYLFVSWDVPAARSRAQNGEMLCPPRAPAASHEGTRHAAT